MKHIFPREIRGASGLTVLEALVVLFILTIASTLVIIDFRSSQNRFALQNSVQELALNIRRVQALAFQTKEEGGVTPARYGIYINNSSSRTSYILFGDQSGVGTQGLYDSGTDLIIEQIKFPSRVGFPTGIFARLYNSSGIPCGGGASGNAVNGTGLHVTFKPPDPTVVIRRYPVDDSTCFKACIYVEGSGTGRQEVVGVSETGLVNIYRGTDAATLCASDV